ncbi:uncharacterized protein LOC123265410 [Cotesia glomerata]|uniref:EGF-like domain-containing protein n=1 Tax=Cotesia glomerata TaxID=32391 RepID=A0AAV7IX87_COTGL|nr:uncharacterized protein LOC123265410 [Cotesia glomerata]KAH0561288.1 hypothetical protein KQX54_016018 [Cotesia glomerata]
MTCAPLLNTSCRHDECKIESSHCIERKCQCKPGYSAVSTNQCVKTSSLYSCTDISHSADSWHFDCSKEKKCVCKANNSAINNLSCLPVLGGICWKDDQCVTQNPICVDFRCRCKSGFILVSHNMCESIECRY